MWEPIETAPKDRTIEVWHKEAGISVAVILVEYPWCNELTLHVCLTGMMEPISKFSHWREPSPGPDGKSNFWR